MHPQTKKALLNYHFCPFVDIILLDVLSIHALEILALSNPCIDVPGHAHGRMPVKFDLFSCKKVIDLLEGKVTSLRVKEIYQRKEAEIENWQTMEIRSDARSCGGEGHTSKVYVRSITDVRNADGCDFDNQESANPWLIAFSLK